MADEPIKAALVRLRNGDIDGLSILVEEYQVQATRIAFLITQDKALAEDVALAANHTPSGLKTAGFRRAIGGWSCD